MLVITNRSVAAPNVRCFTWDDVSGERIALEDAAHVVVDPSGGLDHLQANVARMLRHNCPAGRFELWVLDRDVDSSVVGFTLEQFAHVGEVSSSLTALRGSSFRSLYRINPTRGVLPVCTVRTEDGTAVVGALDPRRRVLALPAGAPVDLYVKAVREVAAMRRSWAIGLHVVAFTLVLLFTTLALIGRADRSRRVVDLTLTADQVVFWVPSPSVDETWSSAEGHMADRVMRRNLNILAELAGGPAAPGRLDALAARLEQQALDTLQQYDESKPWPPAKAPFYLALLRGDVASSFRIVRAAPSTQVSPTDWVAMLNATYWQTAVESLYELQFDKAVAYAELYAAASQHVVQQAQIADYLPNQYVGSDTTEWESGLVGERNRTLAQILLREARAGRLGPICDDPNRSLGFAYVLPRGGGTPITTRTARALADRRARHRPLACGPASRYAGRGPDFALLPRMQELRSAAALSQEDFVATLAQPKYADACREFPVECEFSRVVANLKSPRAAALDSALTAAVRFAGSCSYLSDDALYFALRRSKGLLPGSQRPLGIRASRRVVQDVDEWSSLPVLIGGLPAHPLPTSITPSLLGSALACVTPAQSDFYPTLAKLIEQVPCTQLGPLPPAADSSSLLQRERARCRR